MPTYMDVHRGMKGVTADQLGAAHEADLAIQAEENVHFQHAWADPETGCVFCLADGPSMDAVLRVHEKTGHPADEIYAVPLEV